MEKSCLFVDYLNVTQTMNNNFSHQGDKAIDIAGKDSNILSLKAPFTGTIKRIATNSNAVWIESNDKVKYADGTTDYMTVMTIHDNDISDLYVGKVITQGTRYYDEGNRGNATGNHIHIAAGKGKFTGNGWYQNKYGVWCINNQYDIYKALYLPTSVNIINDGGYNWVKTDSMVDKIEVNSDIYTVVKGDTLTKIAKKYNTTVNELARLNDIENINLIFVGQKLLIPNNKVNYYKKYTGSSVSIVDALKSINEDSSFSNRKKVAFANGLVNYVGSSTQNIYLLSLLKVGKLIKV